MYVRTTRCQLNSIPTGSQLEQLTKILRQHDLLKDYQLRNDLKKAMKKYNQKKMFTKTGEMLS